MLANKPHGERNRTSELADEFDGIIKGNNQPGVPGGTRIPRNFPPCKTKPMKRLSAYTMQANTAVTTIRLVTVRPIGDQVS